jgi:site-specific recombinase XerD
LAPNTVTQRLAALRFFYGQVLKRGWSVAETPYPKKVLHLPQVLSQEEVRRILSLIAFHEKAGRSQVDFSKLPTITRLISPRLNYRLASHSPFWHCNQ